MRINTMTTIALTLGSLASAAAGQEMLWSRDHGGGTQDGAWAIEATSDGGFIAAGFTRSFSPNSISAAYLVKTDADGQASWTRTFELSPLENIAAAVAEVPGGGYALAGRAGSNGDFDSFLIRTNANGDELWHRTYDAGDDDRAHGMTPTSDGGFILVGQAWFGDELFGSYDLYVVKTDADGGVEWTRVFEYADGFGAGADIAFDVQEVSTGGYVIAGYTQSIVWDGWLIRTDELGVPMWDRTYASGFNSDVLTSVREVPGGGFVLGGLYATPFGDVDMALVRTDEAGEPIWTKRFGQTGTDDDGRCVRLMPDGGFVLAGYTSSFGNSWDMYVVRTDADGETLWTDVHGGDSDDRAHAVAVGNGAIVAAGWAWSFGAGFGDVHLAAWGDPALGCAADFNGDGSLDILDFVAFQDAFTLGDAGADCDGSGTLDILDFVCFQNLFQAGCP